MAAQSKAAPKVNNAAAVTAAKIEVRRKVLDAIGADRAKVMDAYAGDGEMYRAVWKRARAYTGCDLKFFRDDRHAFVGDNRRVLRAVDLGQFNIFDLDAYGSPWEQAMIIAERRTVDPGETLGLAITEGSAMKMKLGGMPIAMKLMAGVTGNPANPVRESDQFLDAALAGLAKRLNTEIKLQWRAIGKTGARVRYVGLVVQGKGAPGKSAVQLPVKEGAALSVRRRVAAPSGLQGETILDDPGV